MTEPYLIAKAHEALEATGGDKKAAQKLLITWAVRDQALLLGLAKPHLKNLASAQIDRAARGARRALSQEDKNTLLQSHTKGEKRSPAKAPSYHKGGARPPSFLQRLVTAFKGNAKIAL